MKKTTLLLPACAALFFLSAPANAVIMVVGSQLAHDCYMMAKAGVDPVGGIKTCTLALENQALNRHDRAGTMVNRGTMSVSLKRIDDALRDYDSGIALYPELADAYVDRAGAYILQKRYDEAMIDVNKGIALGPTDPYVGYYNRAVAEQLMGKYKEAYYDYKKVLELEPRFTPASERLKDFVVTRVPAKPATP